ncbi:hypothetical protein NSK_006247 [Nannochloropsis salina CCMP1776]|uniref:Uncharacterized protein n=1 Tax=Nannochloropsis salina CCMP1776 TaxID=1027361 RepID=A0A4D9CT72_9STRA|nr:hypothetical protein NSK_006247 [Nannochloropsis salina CCMP1776]|eukprot:TFJ82421.1 hypothetical protein NSK_006247 [Nannochloropsis salina CCMP1776]
MKASNSLAISQASSFADPEELRRRQARAARFGPSLSVPSPSTSTHPAPLKKEESRKGQARFGPVVGTCAVVEKDYTRSADDFDPALVRPPPVLQEALRCVKAHWAKHEDYAHACSQLKSIRQDLRVQHVEDAFTVHVRREGGREGGRGGEGGEGRDGSGGEGGGREGGRGGRRRAGRGRERQQQEEE